MKTALLLSLVLAGLTLPAAALEITAAGSTYNQSFDSLTTATSAQPWANNSTLAEWYLFQPSGDGTVLTYLGGNGSSNAGSFYSFGAAGATDRALGAVASGGSYFGSPATGAVAGWIAASFSNKSGAALTAFSTNWDGEQWRNGGNTSPQTMVFEYGFGSSFTGVTSWLNPGGGFDFTSPVTGATAAVVDGNVAGLVPRLGGTVSGLSWADNDTLWLRWRETNDTGNDHGLGIDNFSFTARATPTASVPEGGMTVLMLGLSLTGMAVLRRRLI